MYVQPPPPAGEGEVKFVTNNIGCGASAIGWEGSLYIEDNDQKVIDFSGRVHPPLHGENSGYAYDFTVLFHCSFLTAYLFNVMPPPPINRRQKLNVSRSSVRPSVVSSSVNSYKLHSFA